MTTTSLPAPPNSRPLPTPAPPPRTPPAPAAFHGTAPPPPPNPATRDRHTNLHAILHQPLHALQDANFNVTALVTPFTAEADANGDDCVGTMDMNILMTHYGLTVSGGDAVGDFNHDGTVDILDYNTLVTHLGNTATGSTWQVTERLAYSPYGAFTVSVRDNTGTWHNNWGDYLAWNITFQGGRWNPLTQQVLFQNRELDVNTGRWLSWDPTGYPNGPDAYLAFAANPINMLDPTGRWGDPNGNFISWWWYWSKFALRNNGGGSGSAGGPAGLHPIFTWWKL